MKEFKGKNAVIIPDEWVYDYSKSDEYNDKSWKNHQKAVKKAWEELDKSNSLNDN